MKKILHDGHAERYKFCRQFIKNKIVLDAACGFGAGTEILAETAKLVVGVDLNDEELGYAREDFNKKNIEYIKADITKLPFLDDTFDAAISLEAIEHLDSIEQHKFLKELKRVVKEEGVIIISTPEKNVWHKKMAIKHHDHKNELTKKELAQLLNQYLKIMNFYGQWKTWNVPITKRIIRSFLNFFKRLDFLGLRYTLLNPDFRKNIDLKSSLVNQSNFKLEKLQNEELAAQLLVICKNIKMV